MAKKRISIFTSIQGHRSISDAIERLLGDKYEISTYFERDDVYNFYAIFYQFFPGFFKVPFNFSKQKPVMDVLTQITYDRYYTKVSTFIEEHKPDLCISTYFSYNSSLEEICADKQIPFINVLTDPRTVHPFVIAPRADANTVFDAAQEEICREYSPDAKYVETGWFVRKDFQEKYDQKKVRKSLGLDEDTFTILISSGSEGTNIIGKILPALFNLTKPTQLIIACGSNTTLYHSIKALTGVYKSRTKITNIIPLEFTPEMHRYIQAADIVFGKAGPNTLFESVAALTPFCAITHISGQEDGNLEIIRDYQLGYVEERMFKLGKLVKRILAHPDVLQKFREPLQKMAAKNKRGEKKFVELVERLLK